jgi:hypothetical protein
MPDHNHIGEPTYAAYVHENCRHPDCKAAAIEYRQRLQKRRRQGDWQDLRYKDEPQKALEPPVIQALAEPSPAPETAPAADPGPPMAGSTDAADQHKVLAYMTAWADRTTGQVLPAMDNLELVAMITQITPDRAEAAAVALVKAGRLRNNKSGLYLVSAA